MKVFRTLTPHVLLTFFFFFNSEQLRADTGQLFCYSQPGFYSRCRIEGEIQSAYLYQQYSLAPCVYGYTWGYDARSLWVYNGCQATFNLTYTPLPTDPGDSVPTNPSDPDTEYLYRECVSTGWDFVVCPVVDKESGHALDILNAHVQRDFGESRCSRNYNWSINHRTNSIEVERGCAAEFKIKVKK
jgi:hypothetical protein